jgi:hypothetical protein
MITLSNPEFEYFEAFTKMNSRAAGSFIPTAYAPDNGQLRGNM